MGKIDTEFRSKSSQSTIGCVKQGVRGKIIHRSEPLPLRIRHRVSAIFRWGLYGGRKKRNSPRFSHIGQSSFMRLHLCTLEALITVVAVNHAEDIEPEASFRWNINVLCTELPSVWHIAFRADMAFISVVEVNETGRCLSFEFLQLLHFMRIELRRGLSIRKCFHTIDDLGFEAFHPWIHWYVGNFCWESAWENIFESQVICFVLGKFIL